MLYIKLKKNLYLGLPLQPNLACSDPTLLRFDWTVMHYGPGIRIVIGLISCRSYTL